MKHPRQPASRAKKEQALYTVVLWIIVIALVLMLGTISVIQTLDAERTRTAIAVYEGQNQQLRTSVDEMDEELKGLKEEKEQWQARSEGIVTLADQLDSPSFAYQTKYPSMVVPDQEMFAPVDAETVYLTFDDGPTKNTATILDSIKAANIQATFFVVGANIKGNEALLKRMVAEGHTIGIHTYTHNYKDIYESVDTYLTDFYQTYDAIEKACGVTPSIFRFPGGSINSYNSSIYQPLIAELLRRGFVYYDWSVDSRDADGKKYTAEQLTANVTSGVLGSKHAIVLLHDASDKQTTAQAVPRILDALGARDYYFAALTSAVQPVTFAYTDR